MHDIFAYSVTFLANRMLGSSYNFYLGSTLSCVVEGMRSVSEIQ
jgi:hypothetical protein